MQSAVLFVLLTCLSWQASLAQEGRHWYFGNHAALQFNQAGPTSLTNSDMGPVQYGTNDCATISDSSGNLLFYSNGENIWNRNHQLMVNGGNLVKTSASPLVELGQVLAVPMPENDSLYYLFYTRTINNFGLWGAYYSVINMKMNNGDGEVVVRNALLQSTTAAGISVIQHGNGKDYWITVCNTYSPIFYSYKLSATGIDALPVSSDLSMTSVPPASYLKPSPNGRYLTCGKYLCMFNPSSGNISNPKLLFYGPNTSHVSHGRSFSPDSRRIYVSFYDFIRQYTISDIYSSNGKYTDIKSIVPPVGNSDNIFTDIQIGLDNRIYISRYNSTRLSCLQNPNDSASACTFIDTAVTLSMGVALHKLPGFYNTLNVPSLRITIERVDCYKYRFSFAGILDGQTFKEWQFGDGNLSNDSIATHTYTPTTVDSFLVSFKRCRLGATDTLTKQQWVHIPKKPLASFTYLSNGCTSDTVRFNGIATMGNTAPIATSQWDFGDNSTMQNILQPSKKYTDTGSYIVKLWVKDTLGCVSDTILKTVMLNKKIKGGFIVTSPVCSNVAIALTDTSKATNTAINHWAYYFSPTDSLISSTTGNQIFKIKTAGAYSLKQLITSVEGCTSDTVLQNITVLDTPAVNAGMDKMIKEGSNIVLDATATGTSLSFSWNPLNTLDNPTLLQPLATPKNDITYTLTVTQSNGCIVIDSVHIQIIRQLIVPNAFSPNEDNINDTWEIPNLSSYPFARISVFNRHGQVVFESVGYAKPWDGKRGGKNLPVGTYYYIIQLGNGGTAYAGTVLMIR